MRSITRRRMLRGLGGLAIAVPFLPSLDGDSRADALVFPKRFVYVSNSCGEAPSNWWPSRDRFDWTELAGSAREAPLEAAAGQGGLNKVLGPDFDDLLHKMIFLRGMDLFDPDPYGGHIPPCALNAARNTAFDEDYTTIDQRLANSAAVYPSAPAGVRSIHTMSKYAHQAESTLSIGLEGAVFSDSGPTATWQRLFGTFVPDDPIAQKRKNLEAGIIDRVRGDFDQVLQHPRLGAVDRDRLTGHMELLHDLHQRLLALGKACSLPDAPTDPAMDNETGLDEVTALNIALVTAGLACDRTRIAVIQLGVGTDYRFDHHNVQHSASTPEGFEKYTQIHRHYGDQLAALLHAMDSVVEDPVEGTTLLDNSVVLFCNEDGTSNDGHIGPAMPAVLAGGCGGYFRTGRYLDLRPEIQIQDGAEVGLPHAGVFGSVYTAASDFRGRLYNSLLLSLIEAMGDTPPEGGIGSYHNPYAESDAYDLEAGRKPLPQLKA